MKLIDVHAHAFPDAIAERAIAALEAGCPWKAFARGRTSELLASMDAAGVDASVVCTIATKPDQAEGILRWCEHIRGPRLLPFPSVHPLTPDGPAWVARIAAADFPGIKLHPMYQDFVIDDPAMDALYAAAAQAGIIVAFHCGHDIAFPPDDDRAAPRRTAAVLDRFPALKVICTHMGGWRMWDEADAFLVGRDVYLETSFSLAGLGPARAADMIRRHGAARVLFGSDWPWARQQADAALLDALPLRPDELQAVRSRNAAALLGLPQA
jgi:hypothetical protein